MVTQGQKKIPTILQAVIAAAGFAATLAMIGCAIPLVTESPDPNKIFKYDLKGTVNGVPFDGSGVIPWSDVYNFKIISRVDVDLFTVSSCHRDFSVESAISIGWFQKKRGYEYEYRPADGIENSGSCLVRIGAYNRDKGASAWGIVDFETKEANLPAQNVCNGNSAQTNGVSVCQSRAGLIQRLVFPVAVHHSDNIEARCNLKSTDGKTWEYLMPQGECVIAFKELNGSKIHRHTTVGYTDILIRGE